MPSGKTKRRSRGSERTPPHFLQALANILAEHSGSGVLRWGIKGETFEILDMEGFVRLLPKYFKTSNFSSFVRQLNMYSFSKVKGDDESWEFRHPLFKRDEPQLIKQLKRKPRRSNPAVKNPRTPQHLNAPTFKPVTPQRLNTSTPQPFTQGEEIETESVGKAAESLIRAGEACSRNYEEKISKLLLLLLSASLEPDKISVVKPLFISDKSIGDLRSLLLKAAGTLFAQGEKLCLDSLLETVSPSGAKIFSSDNTSTHQPLNSSTPQQLNTSTAQPLPQFSFQMSPPLNLARNETSFSIDKGNFSIDPRFDSEFSTPANERAPF